MKGLEVDGSYQLGRFLSLNAALAYLDGKYVKFTNAPLPLEETGHTELVNGLATQVAFKDASGGRLPGISKWNVSGGAEFSNPGKLTTLAGRYFIAADASYRSEYSSNPTPSRVLNVEGYALLNARLGFKSDKFSVFFWARNIANKNYYEQYKLQQVTLVYMPAYLVILELMGLLSAIISRIV
ncbi:TonB-dependent receptor domain-containing protein [Pedobacter sp. NJ-S-72]